ncbi:MAG: HEAT repeat domain-containing protein, partial [Planctomycetota bacterium]
MEGLRSARVALLAGLFLCCLPGTRALALDQEERDAAYKRADAGLKRALARASKDEIAYWVEQLGAVGTPRAIERVLAVGERFPGEPVRTSALQALVWSKSDTCLEFYDGELKRTRDPERAILIIEALERIKNPLSVTPLIAALQARDTRVLLSALRALRQKPSPEAVEGCIAFFKKVEETRDLLWAETRITLLALTGE